MALIITHKETKFGIGDTIRVHQSIAEEGKKRTSSFEGIVISARGREQNKTFMVRRIGVQKIGIERIFPLFSPTIEKIEVVRYGVEGVKRAKLYYIRSKTKRDIESIYSRSLRKSKKSTSSKK